MMEMTSLTRIVGEIMRKSYERGYDREGTIDWQGMESQQTNL